MSAETTIRQLAAIAEIEFNGSRPFDIRVHEPLFYQRILDEGSRGFGNSYMDGWWDCDNLEELFFRILSSGARHQLRLNPHILLAAAQARVMNLQSRQRAFQIGERHYDWGNELFLAMLGRTMAYSCGYFPNGVEDLDQAQDAKLDLVCRKLKLEPGMRLLDIGCGFGSLLRYAAQNYGVSGVGVTVSVEQARLARQLCDGLDVEIREQDYRRINGQFDAIASIGMVEHVGYKNFRQFMAVAARSLAPHGHFCLHTITSNVSVKQGDPWLNERIFPNSMLPSVPQLGRAAEGYFVIEDVHNIGPGYFHTTRGWIGNLTGGWPELEKFDRDRYCPRNFRMWMYYLPSSGAIFHTRQAQVQQIVFSHEGGVPGYVSVR
ncbi:MAG TPA: cyclopropane fatty acyl phospholipid synthase [Candidatus Saccharimonadales bacterium]|nr:cyclopropane fatty acyl phospholipid synthase [Candidatus Saccharimonadales bacterium]